MSYRKGKRRFRGRRRRKYHRLNYIPNQRGGFSL